MVLFWGEFRRLGGRALAVKLCECLPTNNVVVDSARSFVDATREPNVVAFIDRTTIQKFESVAHAGPVVMISDELVPAAIGWLRHDRISHVISEGMLEHPIASEHLKNVMRTVTASEPRLLDWLAPTIVGRRVRLAQSTKREARIERMSEFFDSKGVGARTLQLLRDASEELLTNAFYNAPVAATANRSPCRVPNQSTCPRRTRAIWPTGAVRISRSYASEIHLAR